MLYRRIYETRYKFDQRRQPSFTRQLRELNGLLDRDGAQHPYTLDTNAARKILGSELLRNGSTASEVTSFNNKDTSAICDSNTFYRIASVKNVVSDARIDWRNRIEKNGSNFEIWEELDLEYRRQNTWLPLSRYARGRLAGFRNFTWWTNSSIDPAAILPIAHRLGIPNDWVARHALILKCAIDTEESSTTIRAPSPIDGFLSLIFLSQQESKCCQGGVTIDITDIETLTEGMAEYVLDPVPVSLVHFIPVEVDDTLRSATPVGLSEDLLKALFDFYSARLDILCDGELI